MKTRNYCIKHGLLEIDKLYIKDNEPRCSVCHDILHFSKELKEENNMPYSKNQIIEMLHSGKKTIKDIVEQTGWSRPKVGALMRKEGIKARELTLKVRELKLNKE